MPCTIDVTCALALHWCSVSDHSTVVGCRSSDTRLATQRYHTCYCCVENNWSVTCSSCVHVGFIHVLGFILIPSRVYPDISCPVFFITLHVVFSDSIPPWLFGVVCFLDNMTNECRQTTLFILLKDAKTTVLKRRGWILWHDKQTIHQRKLWRSWKSVIYSLVQNLSAEQKAVLTLTLSLFLAIG